MDVLIVGAGLAGLTAADLLVAAGREVRVVEARPRVGGRMHTTVLGDTGVPIDLGATWHWTDQPLVAALAADLGLEVFPQWDSGRVMQERWDGDRIVSEPVEMAASGARSLRFVGGTQQLCERLAGRLPEGTVSLEMTVAEVVEDGDGVAVTVDGPGDGETQVLSAGAIVITVPPRLALETIRFTPDLPDRLVDVIEATPTWMGEAIKCVAVYDAPFWRDRGLSGSALSEVGPLYEVHDASLADGSVGALWGFLEFDPDYRDITLDERAPRIFEQLARLFGSPASEPVRYLERDWSGDPYTAEDEHRHVAPLPYGDAAFSQPWMGGRLWWAGTETAGDGGGHMEGAIASGRRVAGQIAHRAPNG